jgi:hypothetical protein
MAMTGTTLEVTAHATAQQLRFANIENPILPVAHQVTARLRRNLPQPRLETQLIKQEGLRA